MQTGSLLQAARKFVSNAWTRQRERSACRSDLNHMSREDMQDLALDCGLTPSQFRAMLIKGPRAADELLELMKALGIDEARLRATDSANLNDMKRVCGECVRKSKCRAGLRDGRAVRDYGTICNNADLLRAAARKERAITW